MPTHPLARRLLAEELLRLRPPEEGRRYAAAQRRGRIDPNPHQVDAVVFALRRIPEGGCILADEVGLGKTIEAGLVISQLLAEGTRRVLLIVPKSLVGQWKAELFDLFGLETREVRQDPDTLTGSGVFLVHRDYAGGEKGAPLLWAADPFELVVIDEAHEVFASIHKRYAKDGSYDPASRHAQTAHRVRELIKRHGAKTLLLTATPIQNSLAELWGLVQYVEPTGSLLGRISTFREVFCDGGDRRVRPEQVPELRRRLRAILHRTLRRQADAFLSVPFVKRRARVIDYTMSDAERALYRDVTAWLLAPERIAFSGQNGRLLLIGFLRRMASSTAALAASLRRVAARLRQTLGPAAPPLKSVVTEFADDLEDDLGADETAAEAPPPTSVEALGRELRLVEELAARAEALPHGGKARSLVGVVEDVRRRAARGDGSGKVVIFTESLTTQAYLQELLLESGVPGGAVTLFRGTNEGPRAEEALRAWEREVAGRFGDALRPGADAAMRLALVHEFRERSSILISTEAGAKGLNLQFCETLVNYDLPWNPQRIEQRIGRVHRYGQTRDVTVYNFVARDNEVERLLFEILSQKLELFGSVLDASDAVLHEPKGFAPADLVSAVGYELEGEIARIYAASHSLEEVGVRLRALQSSLDERRRDYEEEQERVAEVIENRLDGTVQRVFKGYEARLRDELAALDQDLDRLLRGYLEALAVPFTRSHEDGAVRYDLAPSADLPPAWRAGGTVRVGRARRLEEGDVLHVGHPLVQAAVEEARASTAALTAAVLHPAEEAPWPEPLRDLVGRRGLLRVVRVAYRGLEPVDHLLRVAFLEGATEPLPEAAVDALCRLCASPSPAPARIRFDLQPVEDAVKERVLADEVEVGRTEQERFERLLAQLDQYLADQALVLRRKRAALVQQLEKLERRQEGELALVARAQRARDLERVQDDIARLDARVESLLAGDDDEYRAWVARLHERRFQRPGVEHLFDVEFTLGGE